jgi:tetratricopeptide (TPR) repeat protein
MRCAAPRLFAGLAALWLCGPAAAQTAAPAPACPEAPVAPLLAYERDFGVSTAPIAVPITQAQLDGQIDTLLASPEPAPSSLDAAGLRDALSSALAIGFLLKDLDTEQLRPRAGLPVPPPGASTDPMSKDYIAASTGEASVAILDRGIVEVLIGSRSSRAGYFQNTLLFRDRATGDFSALLLTPRGLPGPTPAVLALHGRNETPDDFAQRFLGVELAKKGYVVLIPDFSLSDECDSRISARLLREGFTLMGVRAYQTLLALRYLRGASGVEPDRLALLGHSDGSAVAALTARLRGWTAGLIEDYQTEYRDAGAPAANGRVRHGTVPALFPYSAAVNDALTLPAPLLRVPFGYAKPAYRREIFSFLTRTLSRGSRANAQKPGLEPARLSDYLQRALEDLKTGRRPQADEELAAALEIWQTQRRVPPVNDAELTVGLNSMGSFAGYVLEQLAKSPLADRLALAQELVLLRPDEAELVLARAGLEFKAGHREAAGKSLDQAHALAVKFSAGQAGLRVSLAESAEAFGRKAQAASYLDEAEALSPNPWQLSRIAAMRQNDKDYAGALRALKAMTGTPPGDPHAWLARAQTAWSARQSDLTAALLDKAQSAGTLAPQELLAAAVLRRDVGDDARALELLRAAAQAQPDDVAALIELAAASSVSDRPSAVGSLDRAQTLTADKRLLRRIAGLYQDAKENDKALALLQRLTADHSRDAALFLDLGICEYSMNLSTQAVTSLKKAIKLDPKLWEAYLSLGAIYGGQGQQAKATAVYDSALAVKPVKENDPLLAIIRKNRRESAGGR